MPNQNSESPLPTYRIGQVTCWYKKRGFGFIKFDVYQNKPEEQKDIFVHSADVLPYYEHECRPYLMQGEYVEFDTTHTPKGKKAIKVTGLNNGKLMMDFRRYRQTKDRSRKEEKDNETRTSTETEVVYVVGSED